jgi:hypothetical protein
MKYMFSSTRVYQLSVHPFQYITPDNREYTVPELSHFLTEIISFPNITRKTAEALLFTNKAISLELNF